MPHLTSRIVPGLMVAVALASACHESSKPPTAPDTIVGFSADTLNRVALGYDASCALDSLGLTRCWGWNDQFYQFGAPQSEIPPSDNPVASAAGAFVSLARGGGQHKCGIRANGDAVCWGRGTFGQLGLGDAGQIGNRPGVVLGGLKWKALVTGRLTTCGITTTGDGYCWGSNQHGEIGNDSVPIAASGAVTMVVAPVQISGNHKWKVLASGWMHGCGIDTSDVVWCWGNNLNGELGLGSSDTITRRAPVAISGMKFVDVAAGWRHTCGVTTAHAVVCWGLNATGQLGNGTTTWTGMPTPVASSVKFVRVATNFPSSGFYVQLPTPAIQSDIGTTCAISEAGQPYCWGWNASGAVGDGTTTQRNSPTPVSGGLVVTAIEIGSGHACGMRQRAVWCWGSNASNQVGQPKTLVPFPFVTSPVSVQGAFATP